MLQNQHSEARKFAIIHIFYDTSINSYCGVAYQRLKEELKIEILLVYLKSRVAPISNKNLTIPRLELMACAH